MERQFHHSAAAAALALLTAIWGGAIAHLWWAGGNYRVWAVVLSLILGAWFGLTSSNQVAREIQRCLGWSSRAYSARWILGVFSAAFGLLVVVLLG